MIICNNCGFGHDTVEALRACRPWSEIKARQDACPHLNMRPIWWMPEAKRCVSCGYTETVQKELFEERR